MHIKKEKGEETTAGTTIAYFDVFVAQEHFDQKMKSGKNYEELQRCAPGMIKEGICSNKNCRGSN